MRAAFLILQFGAMTAAMHPLVVSQALKSTSTVESILESAQRGTGESRGGSREGSTGRTAVANAVAKTEGPIQDPSPAPVSESASKSEQSTEAHLFRQSALEISCASLPRVKTQKYWSMDRMMEVHASVDPIYSTASEALQRGDLLLAAAHCQKLLRDKPDYPPALQVLGFSMYKLQRYGEAIECFERFLGQLPEAVPGTRQLGHCYHSVGRSSDAMEHYQRILKEVPTDSVALRSLGVVRLRTGDANGAIRDIRAAMEIRPGGSTNRYWLAAALFESDEVEAAQEVVEKACLEDPFTPRNWFLKSQILFELGKDELAEEARERHTEVLAVDTAVRKLQQDFRVNPLRLDIAEQIAKLRLASGDLRQAKTAYIRLLQWARHLGDGAVAERAARSLEGIRRLR